MTRVCFVSVLLAIYATSNADAQAPTPATKPPTSQANPPAEKQADDHDLPWQPGLGRPIPQPIQVSATNLNQASPPPNAPIIQGAQQIPVRRPRSGNSIPGGQTAIPANNFIQNTPNVAAGIPQEHSVVVPAAFIQSDSGSAGQAQQIEAEQRPQTEVVDSRITTVRRGLDVLPNTAGQIWRTYDISPYTQKITTNSKPQQAIIDWILKETGTELWFSEPMGIMNATRTQLHVYHTPDIHARLKPIIDRFVFSRGRAHVVNLKLVTISNPNWRSTAFSLMQPVQVHSPGVEAWLITKENAALLANQIRTRADYQQHNASDLVVTDGQKYVLSSTRPIDFYRSLAWINDGIGRYQPIANRIDEGYSVEFSALSSVDGRTMEAIVGCKIDQIEKMQNVNIDLPSSTGQSQSVQLQIPQMVSWRVNERFRWPADQVLLLSCGVVATPGPQRQPLMGIPAIFSGSSRGRADALMFIEYKGLAAANNVTQNVGFNSQTIPVNPNR